MAAVGVMVFVIAAFLACCALTFRLSVRAVRHHRERRQWNDLVARHQDLDHDLEQIWQHR